MLCDRGGQFVDAPGVGTTHFEEVLKALGIKLTIAPQAQTKGNEGRVNQFIEQDFLSATSVGICGSPISSTNTLRSELAPRQLARLNYEILAATLLSVFSFNIREEGLTESPICGRILA